MKDDAMHIGLQNTSPAFSAQPHAVRAHSQSIELLVHAVLAGVAILGTASAIWFSISNAI